MFEFALGKRNSAHAREQREYNRHLQELIVRLNRAAMQRNSEDRRLPFTAACARIKDDWEYNRTDRRRASAAKRILAKKPLRFSS